MQLPWFSSAPVQRATPAVPKSTNEPMDLNMTTSPPSGDPSTSTSPANPTTSTPSSAPVAPSQLSETMPQQAIQEQLSSSTYISPYELSAPAPEFATAQASAPSPSTDSTFLSVPAPAPARSTTTTITPTIFTPPTFPALSASTTALLARVTSTPTPTDWEAARAQILSQMTTSHDLVSTSPSHTTLSAPTSGRRGRGARVNKRASPAARGTIKVQGTGERGGGADHDPAALGPRIEPGTTTRGSTRGRGRGRGGGRPRGSGRGGTRGGKRKRSNSSAASGADKADTSGSETYTPLPTQSRSGRPLLKPPPFSPALFDSAAPKKRKRHYRRPGEASVCRNCGRGHSPASNAIVFCDGCNGPWHQFCHDPPIGEEVVRVEESEWVCGGCEGLRRERGVVEGRVGGEGWAVEEKRRHFTGLPHAQLVSLLLHASNLHPELPLFAPDARPPAGPSRAVVELAEKHTNGEIVDLASPPVEELEDEDILPYPKAGNGIKLPPESEDLEFLIDDDTVTFSHTWRDTGFEMVDEPYVNGGFMDGGAQQGGLGLLSVGA